MWLRVAAFSLGLAVAAGGTNVATAQDRSDTYSFRRAGVETECTIERRQGRTLRSVTQVFGRGGSSTDRSPTDAAWRESGCAAFIAQQQQFPTVERLEAGRQPLRFDDLMFRTYELRCDGRQADACHWLAAHYEAICQNDTGTEAGVTACARMQSYRAKAAIIEDDL